MTKLSPESAIKLQKILSKRTGRLFAQEELENVYQNLMEFAFALVDLAPLNFEGGHRSKQNTSNQVISNKTSIVFPNYTVV